jgi:hypothetical protein
VGAPGNPVKQGQRRDVRRSHAASERGIEKKRKIAGKSFYKIYDPDRGIKFREIETA